jgi:hypothetical protein
VLGAFPGGVFGGAFGDVAGGLGGFPGGAGGSGAPPPVFATQDGTKGLFPREPPNELDVPTIVPLAYAF